MQLRHFAFGICMLGHSPVRPARDSWALQLWFHAASGRPFLHVASRRVAVRIATSAFDGWRRLFTSFAFRSKGLSPRGARGRERLSHRWLDSHLSWGSRSPGLCAVHLAPDFAGAPFSCLILASPSPLAQIPVRLKIGISRCRSMGVVAESLDGSASLPGLPTALLFHRTVLPLPPELFALVQLPAPQWSSRFQLSAASPPRLAPCRSSLRRLRVVDSCVFALGLFMSGFWPSMTVFPGAVRCALLRRGPLLVAFSRRLCSRRPESSFTFSCHFTQSCLKSCDFLQVLRAAGPFRRDPRAEGVLLSGRC